MPTTGEPGSWSQTGNGTQQDAVVLFPPQPVAPRETPQFGLRASRISGSTSLGDFAAWNCQLVIDVDTRITTSSPFDADEWAASITPAISRSCYTACAAACADAQAHWKL